jgi:hypothetical protein
MRDPCRAGARDARVRRGSARTAEPLRLAMPPVTRLRTARCRRRAVLRSPTPSPTAARPGRVRAAAGWPAEVASAPSRCRAGQPSARARDRAAQRRDAHDELDLLHCYTWTRAAIRSPPGRRRRAARNGVMAESLEATYADADAVRRGGPQPRAPLTEPTASATSAPWRGTARKRGAGGRRAPSTRRLTGESVTRTVTLMALSARFAVAVHTLGCRHGGRRRGCRRSGSPRACAPTRHDPRCSRRSDGRARRRADGPNGGARLARPASPSACGSVAGRRGRRPVRLRREWRQPGCAVSCGVSRCRPDLRRSRGGARGVLAEVTLATVARPRPRTRRTGLGRRD